jgi:dienelactone hydrolase
MPPAHRPVRRAVMFGRDDRALRLDLVTLETEDRHTWDGLLYLPSAGDSPRRRLAAMVVHGSVGNYLSGLPRWLGFGLARAGFPVLSINTRMANYGTFFGTGLLHRTPLDIDAGLDALRRRGYDRIVMVGYSMGATMVTHHQALRATPEVAGLCTLAHPASLPESLRRRWRRYGADPSYEAVEERARERIGDDRDDADAIFVVRRAAGPSDEPRHSEIWTYRTWWHSRGPEADHAVSRRRIGHVRVPLHFVQAGADAWIRPEEGDELAGVAREAGCADATAVTIPGADHVFSDHREAVIGACVHWLDRMAV